jgi:hypothetical protein
LAKDKASSSIGLRLLPILVDTVKVQCLLEKGRIGVASILLLSLFLIASCGSTTPTSAGLILPIACPRATACLNTAKMAGFREHILIPAGNAVSAGKGFYYPPQGKSGWGLALSYRDVEANQVFTETVGTKPLVYPCLVQVPGTQLDTTPNGRQVCLTVKQTKESAAFYSSGVLYQLDLPGSTNLNSLAQKALLLGIAEQLS